MGARPKCGQAEESAQPIAARDLRFLKLQLHTHPQFTKFTPNIRF
jgi:hypothetical protein